MSTKHFNYLYLLGKGSFGQVHAVRRIADGKIYALKEINIRNMTLKEEQEALNEIRILASFQHNNITRYYESFYENEKLCIVTELIDDGDLLQLIQLRRKMRAFLSENQIWSIFVQVSLGTLFLHEQHVLHRDIKSANVFLSKSGVVKIGDLGISKLLAGKDSLARTAIGTPYYLCPEMWQNKPYNNKSDVWSLGIVLYEMTTLNKPFQGNSMNQLHKRVSSGKYEPISNFFSNDLASVIKKILVLDPKYRPTMKEIMDMPEVTRHLYVLPGFRKFGYGNVNNGENNREQISQNYESGINKQDNNIGNIHSRRRRSKSSPPVNNHNDELDNQEENSQQDNEMIEMIQKVPQSVLYPEVKPQFHLAFPLQLKYRSQRKDLVLPAPRYQETQQLRNQYSNSPSTESMPPTSFPLNSTQDSISKVSLYSVLSAVVPGSKLIHGYDTHHDRINTERAKQLPPIRKSNDQRENEKQNKKENSNQIHQVADTERKSVQQSDSQKKPHLPLRVPLPLPIHPLAKQQQQQQLQKPQPKEPQIRQQILKQTYKEQIIKQPKHDQQSKIQPGMKLPPIDRNQQQTSREQQNFSNTDNQIEEDYDNFEAEKAILLAKQRERRALLKMQAEIQIQMDKMMQKRSLNEQQNEEMSDNFSNKDQSRELIQENDQEDKNAQNSIPRLCDDTQF